jgi:hypothetical protein
MGYLHSRFNIPPQAERGRMNLQLGFKKEKPSNREALSKHISKLIVGGDEGKGDIFIKDLLTHKVVINLNVFGSGMINWIGSKGKGTHIVTPNDRSCPKRNEKLTKQHA